MPALAKNPTAHKDYHLLEEVEAGIVLQGQEVKSVKSGGASLRGTYADLRNGELWLVGAHIPPYPPAGPLPEYQPNRDRKLLVRAAELSSLIGKLQTPGLTLVPLSFYSRRGLIKVGLGLGRGKKKADKRQAIKKRDADRHIRQALRRRR